jgi:ADP-heptose:LPS heptosyltransferase
MRGLPSNVVDWSQRTTLLELIAIFRRASFVVSSDSGPMHLAAALQPSKTLAIHRWSDPLRVGPWSQHSWVWKHGKIVSVAQLTQELRSPGETPALEEMERIGAHVLTEMARTNTINMLARSSQQPETLPIVQRLN